MLETLYFEFPDRPFGIELEVSPTVNKPTIVKHLKDFESSRNSRSVKMTYGSKGWSETRKNEYWHVKYDSTCGPKGKGYDHGWEIASYIGRGANDLLAIAEAADYLRLAGLKTNLNCGLHIHVDVSDYTSYEMGILMAHWVKLENFLMGISSVHRIISQYCKAIRPKLLGFYYDPEDIEAFWRFIKPKKLGTHGNEDKMVTLNTVNFCVGERAMYEYDKTTVELRLPQCLLEKDHIIGWTTLIVNLVDMCFYLDPPDDLERVTDLQDVMSHFCLHGCEGLFFFLDPIMNQAKRWFLQRAMEGFFLPREVREEAQNRIALLG